MDYHRPHEVGVGREKLWGFRGGALLDGPPMRLFRAPLSPGAYHSPVVQSTSRRRVRDWISERFLFCLRCSPSHRWDPIKLKNIICREASLAFDSHERHRSSFFIVQDSTHKRESILSLSFTNRLLPAVMIRFMETTSDDAPATGEALRTRRDFPSGPRFS